MKIELKNISKQFGEELLFKDMNITFEQPSSTALLGINGSGKSTLLQLIATFTIPTKGEIIFSEGNQVIDPEIIFHHISYCAPYLELIEEMTLREFLNYHFSFKKALIPVEEMITQIGLEASADKQIEKFSSGMKQRVKLAQALFADTSLVCLDEPCTNLDTEGIALYHRLVNEFATNKILIVASNDANEYDVCEEKVQIRVRAESEERTT